MGPQRHIAAAADVARNSCALQWRFRVLYCSVSGVNSAIGFLGLFRVSVASLVFFLVLAVFLALETQLLIWLGRAI